MCKAVRKCVLCLGQIPKAMIRLYLSRLLRVLPGLHPRNLMLKYVFKQTHFLDIGSVILYLCHSKSGRSVSLQVIITCGLS